MAYYIDLDESDRNALRWIGNRQFIGSDFLELLSKCEQVSGSDDPEDDKYDVMWDGLVRYKLEEYQGWAFWHGINDDTDNGKTSIPHIDSHSDLAGRLWELYNAIT